MPSTPVVASIASVLTSIGADAARHLDGVWRELTRGQGAAEDEQFFRLVTGEPHPLGNMAILRESTGAQTTERAVAPLLALTTPTAVLYPLGVSEAIAQSLIDRGYTRLGAMPAMAVEIDAMAPTTLPAGYEWVRIGSGAAGSEWADVVTDGFGLPRGLARMLSPEVLEVDMAADARTQFFGIRRSGRLVAVSMLHLADGLAGIYCVATLPDERGRGLGAHVTAQALRAAHQVGYRVGILQSSAAGHSVYLGLGFKDFGAVSMFVRTPVLTP